MPKNREAVCSVCREPIKTVQGAMRLSDAPLVCRRCFGEQSYGGASKWAFNPVAGDASRSDS